MLFSRAKRPSAVLLLPVVLLKSASRPLAVLDTNILCFRPRTSSVGTANDVLAARLQVYLLHKKNLCLTLPLYRGKRWLKADILNPLTDNALIDELADSVHAYLLDDLAIHDCSAETVVLPRLEVPTQAKPKSAS